VHEIHDSCTEGRLDNRHGWRSFLKRFDLSPMAWLREQRLEAAHTMLEHSPGMDAAAAAESVAASCGFGRRRHRGEFRLHK
jgi:transcriptional regulator GlxA family with amidase domain